MSNSKGVARCVLGIIGLLPFCLYGGGASFSSLEEEYTPKYCLQLEAAYGDGLMSEGGESGIESMFKQIPLQGKTALDIGSGIGGVAFYLAEKYDMQITGLDVNAWMIDESEKRTPAHLKDRVKFVLSTSNQEWPLDSKFDLIYSKGVLTHLEEKDSVFQECHRLLQDDGLLIITDWLSSEERKWGPNIAKLVELENLALYPESEMGYRKVLEQNDFTLLSVRDESPLYCQYNREIIEKLKSTNASYLFDKSELEASIIGYESILKALEKGELRVLRFVARKT